MSYPKIQQSCNVRTGLDKSIKKNMSGEWTINRKMTRQKKARGLGRKTREEKGKGNQMTALKVPVRVNTRHPQSSLRE